jgi:hypothetical protein
LTERNSRYWLVAEAGLKNTHLFKLGTQKAWQWAKGCVSIRWFTDGEPRYAAVLWLLAHQYLKAKDYSKAYGRRKVWRERGSVPQARVRSCHEDQRFTRTPES